MSLQSSEQLYTGDPWLRGRRRLAEEQIQSFEVTPRSAYQGITKMSETLNPTTFSYPPRTDLIC